MAILLGFVVGFLAGRLSWLMLGGILQADVFRRQNHRGRDLPTAAGLCIVIATLAVEAGRSLIASAMAEATGPRSVRAAVLVAVLGFGLLGLVDDVAGDRGRRGFRGHVQSLVAGRLTTGALKLTGGAAVALVAIAVAAPQSEWSTLLPRAALVALGANTANLFDLAPGRVLKVSLLALFGLAIAALATGTSSALVTPVVVVVAAGLSLILTDLHEHAMLGDTGANVIGAVLALGVAIAFETSVVAAALVVLIALNVAAEFVSFSRVIQAVPPLRALDRAGRLP